MRVYLAGGMKSDWSLIAAHRLGEHGVVAINPRTHMIPSDRPREYTLWDLCGVARADVVLANMEANNPSGIGLAFECGFATAHGIPVVFVDGAPEDPKFWMIRATARAVFAKLDEGIQYIETGADGQQDQPQAARSGSESAETEDASATTAT